MSRRSTPAYVKNGYIFELCHVPLMSPSVLREYGRQNPAEYSQSDLYSDVSVRGSR